MTHVFTTILEMSLGSALLILLVFAARGIAGRKLPMLMPVLCALIVVKLIVPISIQSPLSIQNLLSSQAAQTIIDPTVPLQTEPGTVPAADIAVTESPAIIQPGQLAAEEFPASSPKHTAWTPSTMDIAALIWLFGIAVLSTVLTVGNLRFARMLKRHRPYTAPEFDALLSECKQSFNIKTNIDVICVSSINTAAVYGIFRPKLLIAPDTFDALSETEKRHVLLHELSHIKSKDTLIRLIQTAVNILHWFNPLVWIMFMLMRRDFEVVCDTRVLRKIGDSEKRSYATTLVNLLSHSQKHTPALVTALLTRKSYAKARVKMILKFKRKTPAFTALAIILTVMIAVTGCTTSMQDTSANTTTPNIQPEEKNTANTDLGILVGTYDLDFSDYADDTFRVHNIAKAVSLLDNTVIVPERTASVMGILWPVTAENGWETAPFMSWEDIARCAISDDWKTVGGYCIRYGRIANWWRY